ncbi:histidine kinase N-terminal 7TM domain-containing protein [Halosegnis marinus]|uniref:histidine kinase N-terminal 7TM domain-containing protein n=1 Tax=Halosegnis marinus TaxID=3034023 RepID=UPI00361F87C9
MLPGIEAARLPYVAAFAASAVACLAVAGLLGRRPDSPGERELAGLFVAVGLWAVNSVARVLVVDPVVTRALLSVELVLGAASATLWLLFAARYAGYDPLAARPVRLLFGGFLAVAVLLPVTNGLHGLVWPSLDPVVRQGVVVYAVGRGPGHYAITLTGYGVALVGLYYLVRLLWSTPPARPAVGALLTGFALLIGANLLPYTVPMLVRHPRP